MALTIIIPSHNRKDLLESLLHQINNQLEMEYKVEIIVVLDGATDGSDIMIQNTFPIVHIVYGDGNWWYTRSMNEGFDYAIKNFKQDYFLCLNDDLKLNSDYLRTIINHICTQQSENKIVGSISYRIGAERSLSFSGIKSINFLIDKTLEYGDPIIQFDACTSNLLPSVLLPGRGLLIPVKILTELNGFDNKFFQYQSDFDFCLRARRKGYQSFLLKNAIVFSYDKLTSGTTSFFKPPLIKVLKSFIIKSSRYYMPNRGRYYWRHYYRILWPFYMLKYFVRVVLKSKLF